MKILLRVAKEAKRYKWLLVTSMLSTLMLTVINLMAPKLMSQMTGLVSRGIDRDGLSHVIRLAVFLLVLYLLKILFRYLSNYMAHKAAWELVGELRVKLYNKMQSLSMDFFRDNESGDLVSRTISDTEKFELLYAHLVPETVTNVITVVGVTVILLSINPRLAILTCLPIPLILFSGWLFATKIRPNFRVMRKASGKLSAQLQDNYSGVQEIQAFGQQNVSTEKVRVKSDVFTKAMLRALNMSAVFHPTVEFLTGLGTVIVVGFGGYLAYRGSINVEEIVAFLLYLTLFYAPITGIAQLIESMQDALAGAERVIEVLDTPETVKNKPGAKPLADPKGEIKFDNVSFSYVEGIPIIEDVSFEVKPGEMIALVGATGAGKTTMAQLIARFYDPDKGAITMDGVDLRDIDLYSYHKNVAIVLQDTFLFNGTIGENIAFAVPDAPEDEIRQAAMASRIHDDIMEMPDGYDTRVGERGAKLSGGQKQRIAIARAVLCKAPVLILDEATASVDVKTEADIQQAINELAEKRTIVAIAHRLSTIRRADKILVFKDGKIVQRGNHDELYAQPGIYRDMCTVQEDSVKAAEEIFI